jgi:hypothetical protein
VSHFVGRRRILSTDHSNWNESKFSIGTRPVKAEEKRRKRNNNNNNNFFFFHFPSSYRNDFTFNSVAISLGVSTFGDVTDYFSGVRDAKDRSLRVVHSLVFQQDISAVLRGLRHIAKYDLSMGFTTERMMKAR